MFQRVDLRDKLTIHPSDFDKKHIQALKNCITNKYCMKVICNIGLCFDVYDITSVGDAIILPIDGSIYVQAEFTLMVFRPVYGQILIGKLVACDETGLLVSMIFMPDIFISKNDLPLGTLFDNDLQEFVWHYQDSEMSIECDDPIRLRVLSVEYQEAKTAQIQHQTDQVEETEDSKWIADMKPPMRIIGTIQSEGLGPVKWWS